MSRNTPISSRSGRPAKDDPPANDQMSSDQAALPLSTASSPLSSVPSDVTLSSPLHLVTGGPSTPPILAATAHRYALRSQRQVAFSPETPSNRNQFPHTGDTGGTITTVSSLLGSHGEDRDPTYVSTPIVAKLRRRNGGSKSSVFVTPAKNRQSQDPTFSSNRTAVQNLMRRAGGKHCTVTLEKDPSESLDAAHLIPARTHPAQAQLFERLFGMEPRTLNVDTSDNILWLRSDIHRSFDARGFGFLPTLEALEAIQAQLRFIQTNTARLYNMVLSDEPYEYDLIPLRWWTQQVCLRRLNRALTDSDDLEEDLTLWKTHAPPYKKTGVPRITSHVHPYMVVGNLLDKNVALYRDQIEGLGGDFGMRLHLVLRIISRWRAVVKLTKSSAVDYDSGDDGDGDDGDGDEEAGDEGEDADEDEDEEGEGR